jgi:uncharacterized membrane protein YeaQ/YmgE (transglycosylase-associated protein family)
MDWIIAVAVGAFVGWIASLIMRTDSEQGAIANILIGGIGAAVGRWLFGDILGLGAAASAGTLSFLGLVYGILGAMVLIGILKAVRVLR